MHEICCLICAYNEEKTIGSVVKGCKKYFDSVIVVDDGSTDKSGDAAVLSGAYVIKHPKNSGKGAALKTGFDFALKNGFDAVITLDADGQHDPAEISKFIDSYKNNSGDIIIGNRLWDKGIYLSRYISNRIGVFFISLASGCKICDTQSGFRLYKKEVIENIKIKSSGFEAETEILIKAGRKGFNISSIPVKAMYPKNCENYKTNFKPVRDFYRISILVLKSFFNFIIRRTPG